MNPQGIGGWLLVYVIGPGFIGSLTLLLGLAGGQQNLFVLAVLAANIFGLVLIFQRAPAARPFHIWFNGSFMGLFFLLGIVLQDMQALGSGLGVGVWWLYWLLSARVKNTFAGETQAAHADA